MKILKIAKQNLNKTYDKSKNKKTKFLEELGNID
jgi:hypothetical protein